MKVAVTVVDPKLPKVRTLPVIEATAPPVANV